VVLAAAARAARVHGVDAPVPVTLRFPGDPLSLEDDYQRLVLDELALSDWIVLEPGSELDILGALSTELARRHGSLFPFNAHFAGYMLRHCGTGTLLTGLGGDEVMTPHPLLEVGRMAAAKRPPSLALARTYAATRYPRRAGRYLNAFRRPWLTPQAIEAHTARLVAEVEAWRVHAGNHLREVASQSRWLALAVDAMHRIAGGFGMTIEHPLLDHGVVEALARQRGFTGGTSRSEITRLAFAELLPPALIERTTKASFSEVFWTDLARTTWRDLPLDRIDQNLVDVDRLAEEWSTGRATSPTATSWRNTWPGLAAEQTSPNRCEGWRFDPLGRPG
jgi:hypothetical protein